MPRVTRWTRCRRNAELFALALLSACVVYPADLPLRANEPPEGVSRDDWNQLEFRHKQLTERMDSDDFDRLGKDDDGPQSADARIFLKGLEWAFEFEPVEPKFTAKDFELMRKAVARGEERRVALSRPLAEQPWRTKRGRVARGFVSAIDGSVQPYGIIIPKQYDGSRPMRLDVVLHGSTRPVGLSELRFIDRFDTGDVLGATESPPDFDYLELHPLGRVENGYRWAGETDVFEAIKAVCREYRVDRDRIVLRGMSMGASGTWHLGLKNPDRFVALGPYCGYVDTHRFSETPLPNFVRVGELPALQEKMLHLLDSVDYAANAGVVPAVACMGEKDVFFQAHEIMRQAMQKEGLTMVNLISPGTGHVIDPPTHAEQLRRIAAHVEPGLSRDPKSLRFVTWSLKYHRCHWLRVLALARHYERAEFAARLDADGVLRIDEPKNIVRFAIDPPMLVGTEPRVAIAGRELALPRRTEVEAARPYVFVKGENGWSVELSPGAGHIGETSGGKRPGLQGPIDDAFTSPFLCVRGTGKPWNRTAGAAAEASLDRFEYEWRRYFRGKLLIIRDDEVSEQEMAHMNVILFGDPGSNRLIREALPKLPLKWDAESLQVAGRTYSSSDHLPSLIVPNPLPGGENRYLVLNSGHTFHEPELSTLNYLLFPRQGDWAVWKVAAPLAAAKSPSALVVEELVETGLCDEQWRIVDVRSVERK